MQSKYDPAVEIPMNSQTVHDVSVLSAAGGPAEFGAIFWAFKPVHEPKTEKGLAWIFTKGEAGVSVNYYPGSRTVTYSTTKIEDAAGQFHTIAAYGPDAPGEVIAMLGAAAALGIPVICTGEYFESYNEEAAE